MNHFHYIGEGKLINCELCFVKYVGTDCYFFHVHYLCGVGGGSFLGYLHLLFNFCFSLVKNGGVFFSVIFKGGIFFSLLFIISFLGSQFVMFVSPPFTYNIFYWVSER